MAWLGTNSGKKIDLTNPDPKEILLDDLACGLSNICRFNGQVTQWYSVAEHCLHVAEMVPKEYKLSALLHDAAEAYICDIPTPLKQTLGEQYRIIESRLCTAIGIAAGETRIGHHFLPLPVELADRCLVVSERDAFVREPQEWGPEYEHVIRYPNLRRRWTNPSEAARAWKAEVMKYLNQDAILPTFLEASA